MRKLILCLVCSAVAIVGIFGMFNSENIAKADAKSEIAMELSTGKVLTENNADVKLPMASTTKILTAIIIIEDCNIDEQIKVPIEAVGVEGSSVYLKEEESIDIRDLLYGLMLRSGNDCATALAIHHSGSVEEFAKVMNERAKKIGAENSNFKNPSGLPDSDHYTSARDLCKIARYAMNNEKFKKIVSTKNYTGKFRSFLNKNKILNMYDGANGVKTGYTIKAGRCLVSSAIRDGMDIICVVLDCYDMYERSCEIFDECFNKFQLLKLDENKVFMCGNVLCKLTKSENIVIEKQEELSYKVKPLKNTSNESSVPVAELEIYNENSLLFTRKLYSIIDS